MNPFKFLAPPLSIAFLLVGLCFADASESSSSLSLREPQRVELPRRIERDGSAVIVGYTDFFSSCEEFGAHRIELRSQTKIIVESYVKNSSIDGFCARQFLPSNRKDYLITGLSDGKEYEVYFRGSDGDLTFIGSLF